MHLPVLDNTSPSWQVLYRITSVLLYYCVQYYCITVLLCSVLLLNCITSVSRMMRIVPPVIDFWASLLLWPITALHCTLLSCTALHYTRLHCTALHCTTLHLPALHRRYSPQVAPRATAPPEPSLLDIIQQPPPLAPPAPTMAPPAPTMAPTFPTD